MLTTTARDRVLSNPSLFIVRYHPSSGRCINEHTTYIEDAAMLNGIN